MDAPLFPDPMEILVTTTASTPTASDPNPFAARLRPALMVGAMTIAYYASPDAVSSRPLRGAVKAVLAGGITAVSIDDWRRDRAAARAAAESGSDAVESELDVTGDEELTTAELIRRMPAGKGAALAGVAGGAMAASILVTVAAERWIFRRGQARAAAGTPLAHTLPALLWGGIAAGAMLIPEPEATDQA